MISYVIPVYLLYVCCVSLDSEMYSELCKTEDSKFNKLFPDKLIADIASCMNEDFPVSLEQFYEIDCLIDADVETESGSSENLLFSPDIIDGEMVDSDVYDVRQSESCDSEENDATKMPDYSDALLITISDSVKSDPDSPVSEVESLEYEELYEESVAAEEDVSSTISCEELQGLMESSCGQSVIKHEPLEDAETSHLSWCCPAAELTSSRRLRKKEQNKTAALRYRLKKRSEQGLVLSEYTMLERRNIELRTRLDAMTKEISYLKSLIDELCP